MYYTSRKATYIYTWVFFIALRLTINHPMFNFICIRFAQPFLVLNSKVAVVISHTLTAVKQTIETASNGAANPFALLGYAVVT